MEEEKEYAPEGLEDSRAGELILGRVPVAKGRPKVTALQNPRDEGVLRVSVQGGSSQRSPGTLFSNCVGLPLSPGRDQTQPELCLGAERLPAHGGCPALGESQLLVPQKKSSGSSLRSPSRSSAVGGWIERAGRLSDNIRAPRDSEPKLPPLGRAVREVARPAASTHTDGPEAGPPSTSPLLPTYPHATKGRGKTPGPLC